MDGAMLAEEGGGGVGKEEGESGGNGRSGKRALERMVLEMAVTALAVEVVRQGEESREEVEQGSGREEKEEVESELEPEKMSGETEDGIEEVGGE